MPIRLRGVGGVRNSASPSSPESKGFNISFTNGVVYDLDELTKIKSRINSDAALAIQVIDENKVIQKLIEAFDVDISGRVSKEISEVPNTKSEIISIIQKNFDKYGDASIATTYFKYTVLPAIEKDINAYMKKVVTTYGMEYTVTFTDATTVSIKYDFKSSDELDAKLSSLYDQYSRNRQYISDSMIDEEIDKEVGVGQLAISNTVRNKTLGFSDYKSGLLDCGCKNNVSNNSGLIISGRRKPLIIWSEGTPDNTYDHDEPTLQDEIVKLKKQLKEIYSKNEIPEIPEGDGEWYLKCSVVNGVKNYEWVNKVSCDCGCQGAPEFELLEDGSYSVTVPNSSEKENSDGYINTEIKNADLQELDDNTFNLNVGGK